MIKAKDVASFIRYLTLLEYYNSLREQRRVIVLAKKQNVEKSKGKFSGKHFEEAVELRNIEVNIQIKIIILGILRQLLGVLLMLTSIYIVSRLASDFGTNISQSYYSAISQIYPVLLIAFYLSSKPSKQYSMNQKFKHFNSLNNINSKLLGFVSTLLGTMASLYVLATNRSTTFLFLITILCLLLITGLVFQRIQLD